MFHGELFGEANLMIQFFWLNWWWIRIKRLVQSFTEIVFQIPGLYLKWFFFFSPYRFTWFLCRCLQLLGSFATGQLMCVDEYISCKFIVCFFWNLKVQRTFTKIVVFAVSFFFLNRNHMSFMKQLQFKSNVLPLVLFNTRGTFQVNHSSFRQIHLCFIGKKMPGLGHLGWGTIHNENPIYTWKKWVFLWYIIPFKRGSLGRLFEQLGPYHPKGPPRFSPMICWRWRV